MRIEIRNDSSSGSEGAVAARTLGEELRELGFNVCMQEDAGARRENTVSLSLSELPPGPETLLERALRALPLDFDSLPLLVEGESKILRLWTPKVVVERFKPTVYSYTSNRYGVVSGTDDVRVRISSELLRRMARLPPRNGIRLQSAFLAEREHPAGRLMIQRRVDPCNLEVRLKRYHIGSPTHRYRYTEQHPTANGGPLMKWTRFETPLVCFDWRNPLTDDQGQRLADEPLPDDYAAIWMRDVTHARRLARETFLWLEEEFARIEARLIDMCLFIDREGRTVYGEISPDCMRVRLGMGDPAVAYSADKDLWRSGRQPEELSRRYEELYQRLVH
jgi:phosphoribosylaminoimidazole-succinocarboxamide synthase